MAKYERLSPLDRTFLDLEYSDTHMHVAGVMLFEAAGLRNAAGGIDIDRIRRYVESRLHLIPRYRQKIALIPVENHPVWVDDDRFNIDYHVRHTSLPRPGDDEQLKRLAGRIVSQQLDRGKPLWELWIVEGLSGDRFAMISKTHHCMIDGVSAIDLASVLLSPVPNDSIPEPAEWNPERAPSGRELVLEEARRRLKSPLEIGQAVIEAIQNPADTAESLTEQIFAVTETLGAGLFPASDSPFNQPIGPHRRFEWTAIDLADVKRVKNALGGTVNDVVLATVAGAVGAFLRRRGIGPEAIAALDFRAMVPVSMRGTADRGTLGNRIASWAARLPIAEADPRRRLAAVRAVTADLKQSRQAMGAEVLARVSEWTVPTLLSLAMRLAARARSFNLTVTNVPGPQIPLYLLGCAMKAAYPLGPLFEHQALNIALLSYDGALHWGFNADYDALPDLRDLVDSIHASFEELMDAAAAERPQKENA
ncbi:MAG TPA: wax ester/triacylglycerol synthase family O-acyltransferase [Candidatus Acidoferrales bacterium]|nr:wax ester/triacylglycerol synthase family O-acyltransferase [Candidatus Acidoferrales bacterium]